MTDSFFKRSMVQVTADRDVTNGRLRFRARVPFAAIDANGTRCLVDARHEDYCPWVAAHNALTDARAGWNFLLPDIIRQMEQYAEHKRRHHLPPTPPSAAIHVSEGGSVAIGERPPSRLAATLSTIASRWYGDKGMVPA